MKHTVCTPLLALAALLPVCTAPHAAKLNDTGQIQCLKAGVLSSDCALTKQDAAYGRDVALNNNADGKAGFSFEKIAVDGSPLPPTATAWSCVKDNLTGLMWEMKTADGGLHDKSRVFDHSGTDTGASTRAFVNDVNAAGLCGHTDWRMPTRVELSSIVDYGSSTAIDEGWFPNPSDAYWTDSKTHTTSFWFQYFEGAFNFNFSSTKAGARVVRNAAVSAASAAPANAESAHDMQGPEATAVRFVYKDDTVKDKLTGLTWKRCSVGQTWDGSNCAGTAQTFQWVDAVAQAASTSAGAWRLPNAKELSSIVDERGNQVGGSCSGGVTPAIDPVAFPGTYCGNYWTSTFKQSDISDAWAIDFRANGSLTNRDRIYFYPVRLVRGKP